MNTDICCDLLVLMIGLGAIRVARRPRMARQRRK